MIWISYTTRYRTGSDKFARAAETMRAELCARNPGLEVRLDPLVRKGDFVAALGRIAGEGKQLRELHFIGHSGMYGIMFGSVDWPEQFSPHEWRQMRIPFAPGAHAYFHACRTGRWFAPFFARTFGVRAHGHHGYTTVSTAPDRFAWEPLRLGRPGPLYLISCPGKKSHGLGGSLTKYLGAAAQPMDGYAPQETEGDASYDAVAALYDRAFADIRVRRDEWRWLNARLDRAAFPNGRPRVLDLGCGTGALLRALEGRIAAGVGVDTSAKMVAQAMARAPGSAKLRFQTIAGPALPFADGSFDLVTSFLSFRYLDWDPIMQEIRRLLAPGGHLMIVDMVERALGWREAGQLATSAAKHLLRPLRDRRFVRDVAALTSHPDWKTMLKYNPIRAQHEYQWYLESRFPGRKLEILNVGRRQRLVAFDTGPLSPGAVAPLSYP
ncbi:MAG TPA: class I SAM-dependent methyltransferase [Polyangia bacterium]|nr:class I SAM-dependent methyltransferase [Polyangia bacterium]